MIEPDPVEAVFEREHALNLVGLDHGGEHIAYGDRLTATGQIVGDRQYPAQIIRRMPPLRGKPGVVEIQPADHRADVERGIDRIELVGGTGNASPALQRGTGHHRTHELGAGGILERLESAGERIHEAIARGLVGKIALDLEGLGVIRDGGQ